MQDNDNAETPTTLEETVTEGGLTPELVIHLRFRYRYPARIFIGRSGVLLYYCEIILVIFPLSTGALLVTYYGFIVLLLRLYSPYCYA